MATADAKFILMFVMFDAEFIGRSLVDIFIFVRRAIVSAVCMCVTVDGVVRAENGRRVLVEMRDIWLLVEEGQQVLRSVPGHYSVFS